MKKLRKSGILALIATAFYFFYWSSAWHSMNISMGWVMSSSFMGPSFWGPVACYVAGAFTPPLISLILFVIAGFVNGITTLWGIISIVLAVIAFFEWRRH